MRVAITGGSGSLGRALIRRLSQDGADRIVTFSRDEQKRHALAQEFGWHPGFRVMAGDVRDADRLPDLFHGCEVVVHAAARKVVTAHPDEPEEMLKTNVLGTTNVISAACKAQVRSLLFISSDKAVRAENVYGVSKAMAEHLAVNANARTLPQGLRVGVLRYGNVLASRGSVLQVWRDDLAAGRVPHLSDPQMTRFWLTLDQAVGYVISALGNLRGGEILVPHLPAAPVLTLLKAMNGQAEEDHEARYVSTGIRPGGEKLHEELLSASEARRAVRRNGFYVIPPFQHGEMWDAKPWIGTPVPADFVYQSDRWPVRLTVEGMRDLLAQMKEGA